MKKNLLLTFLSAMLICTSVFAQQGRMLSGTVTDSSGEPVIGATVVYAGSNTGTVTNEKGEYTIPYLRDKTLTFSTLGMESVSVRVADQTTINVSMKSDASTMDDLVVIGYATVQRRDLTGSVTSFKAEDIKKSGSNDVFGALQGRVAGLSITSQSGEPGAGYQIKIRGNNSINAGTTPLFVIDGMQMEISSGEVASSSATGYGTYDPLSFINPSDIESIEILKDASATAIYGARGANGVVIITTKSGSSAPGRTVVSFDASMGISEVPKTIDMLDKQGYIDYRFARKDYGWTTFGVDTNGDEIPDTPLDATPYENFNWQDMLYRKAVTQNYNVLVSSMLGNGTQLEASLGYLNEEGLVINNDYIRYTGRIKLDHAVNKKVKIGVSANYGYNISNGAVASGGGSLGYSGLIQMIYLFRPTAIWTDAEGDTDFPSGWIGLPSLVSEETFRRTTYQRIAGNAYLNWNITDNLIFRTQASANTSGSKLMEFYSPRSTWGASRNGFANNKAVDTYAYNVSSQITFKKKWNAHSFDAMVGAELNKRYSSVMGISSYDFEDTSTGPYNLAKGGIIEAPTQNIVEGTSMSMFGRANYIYNSKYYITVNMRADGSSKFFAGNRVGYFPSVALAWRATEETFLKNRSWLDNLKLRLSAGVTGNDRISEYAALARLTTVYYASGGNEIMGMAPSSSANPGLKWETTYQYNIGIDLGLFRNRIDITADAYFKDTRDMLYQATLSAQSGYNLQWQNLGRVENKGIELTVNTHNIDTKDFNWSSSFTFDVSRNCVRDIGGIDYTSVNISSGQLSNDISRIMVGQPIGIGYGYVWDGNYQLDDFVITDRYGNVLPSSVVTSENIGLFKFTLKDNVTSINSVSVQPGDRKYLDLDGDGEISTADRTVISDSNPDFTVGFGNTFSYKNFDFSFFFEGVFGRDIMNEFKLRSESGQSGGTQFNNLTADAWKGHWTPENGSQTYSRLLNQTNTYVSSYYVEDGTFVRLKTISLGYTFGKKITQTLRLQSARLYASVSNALLWTNYSGMDPDVSSPNVLFPGFDRMSYPKARIYTFGLNLTF